MTAAAASTLARPRTGVRSGQLLDVLLFASVFTITFAKVRWSAGGADVNISDVLALLFVATFAVHRVGRGERRIPRTAAVLLVFFALFSARLPDRLLQPRDDGGTRPVREGHREVRASTSSSS